ncbi:MAG: SAM-dependent methyltransferase [Anaerolineae bacterium]|nr:SAM-dependent methyltransferase [Anaerolineae bacterium]
MSDEKQEVYQVHPIGYVREEQEGQFIVEILEPYRPALNKLEHFSHVHVLWWAHELDNDEARGILQADLPYAPGTRAGMFACRGPVRPNPILMDVSEIIECDEKTGIVRVAWLDAVPGSPVIDLKPYIPVSDRVRGVRVPSWLEDWPEWLEDAADFDFGDMGG